MASMTFNVEVDLKTALKFMWCGLEEVIKELPDYHPNSIKVVELAKEKFFPMLDEVLKLDDPEDYENLEEFNEVCDKIADLINEISEDMKNDY